MEEYFQVITLNNDEHRFHLLYTRRNVKRLLCGGKVKKYPPEIKIIYPKIFRSTVVAELHIFLSNVIKYGHKQTNSKICKVCLKQFVSDNVINMN